jgi:hypothetical protein
VGGLLQASFSGSAEARPSVGIMRVSAIGNIASPLAEERLTIEYLFDTAPKVNNRGSNLLKFTIVSAMARFLYKQGSQSDQTELAYYKKERHLAKSPMPELDKILS